MVESGELGMVVSSIHSTLNVEKSSLAIVLVRKPLTKVEHMKALFWSFLLACICTILLLGLVVIGYSIALILGWMLLYHATILYSLFGVLIVAGTSFCRRNVFDDVDDL
jgi:hypothetical protein